MSILILRVWYCMLIRPDKGEDPFDRSKNTGCLTLGATWLAAFSSFSRMNLVFSPRSVGLLILALTHLEIPLGFPWFASVNPPVRPRVGMSVVQTLLTLIVAHNNQKKALLCCHRVWILQAETMTCKIHPRLEKMRRRDVFLVCYAMQCICIDKVALPEGKNKRKKKSPFRMFLESLLDKRVAGFIKNAWGTEYRVLNWLLSAISSLHPEY